MRDCAPPSLSSSPLRALEGSFISGVNSNVEPPDGMRIAPRISVASDTLGPDVLPARSVQPHALAPMSVLCKAAVLLLGMAAVVVVFERAASPVPVPASPSTPSTMPMPSSASWWRKAAALPPLALQLVDALAGELGRADRLGGAARDAPLAVNSHV